MKIQSFVFNAFQENTYVLWDDTREAIVIDPGCYEPSEERELKNFIITNNLNVVGLYNTHCHIDHVLGNQFVKSTFGVPLVIHSMEKDHLASVPSYSAIYGFERYAPCQPDEYLTKENKIYFGNSELEILFVPGHSVGHIAFYSSQYRFCISGDVLFLNSVGRTDLPGGDMPTLLKSIREVLFQLPLDTKVYSGHGDTTTIGFEKQSNPFCAVRS